MLGGALMELSDKSLEAIGQYVKENLAKWLQEMPQKPEGTQIKNSAGLSGSAQVPTDKAEQGSPRVLSDTVLLERLIRLEEELKAQRTIMETRFEAIDKRFDDIIHYMDKRFESVDKRFYSVQWVMVLGFTLLAALMAVFNFF